MLAEEALAGERFGNMTERVSSGGKAISALSVLFMIWGYNWVVMKAALQYSSPFDYAALRVLLGGISLFLVLIWLRKPLLPTIPETVGMVLIISALVFNSTQAMKPLPRCRS